MTTYVVLLTGDETAWERLTAEQQASVFAKHEEFARLLASRLAALDGIALPGHRLPATRAELLARAGRTDEALRCFATAIALCHNESERAHLEARRESWLAWRPA
ncbi:hypothetical protein [Prauserella flavalba]|uniref:hypothetical protein n=1 Tax=Prauserella flavalba TaxID=1477506 RepID=UPI0036E17708